MSLLYTRTRAFRRPPPVMQQRRGPPPPPRAPQLQQMRMFQLQPPQQQHDNSNMFNKNSTFHADTQSPTQSPKLGGTSMESKTGISNISSPRPVGFEDDDTVMSAPDGIKLPDHHYILNATPYVWVPPPDQKDHPYKEHQGEGSQYLRDFILGVNDGLVSTLLLVLALVGGGSTSRVTLLSAISATIAGAISMGLGEYVATKSQNEVVAGETKLELEHFKYHRDKELEQLQGFLASIGIDGALNQACVRKIGGHDDTLMTFMNKFEFGCEASEELERNPFTSMFMSGRVFIIGSLPSILPFVQNDATLGLILACVFSGIALFGVGVYKTKTTGGSAWRSGGENLVFGAVGGAISFVVGLAYNEIRLLAE